MAKVQMTKEQRSEQAKRAWDTIRANKAAGIKPAAQREKTTSKDEQLERLRSLMKSWFSNEPFATQEVLGEVAVEIEAVATPQAPTVETAPEVPAVEPEVIATPEPVKKGRSKKASAKVETIDIEPAKASEAPAPTVDLLDSIVSAQQPDQPKRKRKAA